MRDFGNSSFQLELPAHLKRRGIHDVFHSSLLRIHLPNDDRLFPGRMDTQLARDDDDTEWAVDRVLSHYGSKTDASFEILWKSGDVTWLPYYQVTHLQALTNYLELLKVVKISKLPTGRGRPPSDDPQVSLGSIVPDTPSPSLSQFFTFFGLVPTILNTTVRSLRSTIRSCFCPTFQSLTVDLEPVLTMPPTPCVNHPRFTRISPTHYVIRNDDGYTPVTLHPACGADS